ncbi:MAG: hypothetical protein JO115_02195 [Pseudonocardiales bacterium]|nr:hypothetical protein [Pseudonocardiales bacterium]
MALMLPDHLATALSLVGIPWPNIDEDELRHCAGDVREFASSLTDSVRDTSGVVSDTVGHTDAAFARAVAAQWEGRPGEIAVLSAGCDVLARALEVIAGAVQIAKDAVIGALGALAAALLAGGPADLLVGGFEVEIAERVIKAALDVLEQQVVGQLMNVAIQPLMDRIPATVRNFLAGSAEAVPAAAALKADYTQLDMAATRLATHAHRTDTTGETLRRRSSSRNVARGGSPIGATLKQALETVLKDLAEQIPKVVAQVQRDMGLFLKKAAKDLEQTDKKLNDDARTVATAAVGRGHPEGDGPVVFRPRGNWTPEENEQLRRYVESANRARDKGMLSPTGRVSTKGELRAAANEEAREERVRAIEAGTQYQGQVGHAPDTTWTGKPEAFEWHDQTPRVNSSLGAQARQYPEGYKPTEFKVGEPRDE